MGKIVVEVMPKVEILDPQGKAIKHALEGIGLNFEDVRQGKRFELATSGDVTESDLANAKEAAEKLLSNPIIESVISVHSEK